MSRSLFALSPDADAVRTLARSQLAGYPRLPYYSQMLIDAGYEEAARGTWSDAMIDAVVAHGDAAEIERRLRAIFAAGVGEIIAAPLIAPEEKPVMLPRLLDLIATIGESD